MEMCRSPSKTTPLVRGVVEGTDGAFIKEKFEVFGVLECIFVILIPCPGVGMNPMIASKAVLIDQLGCHDSGWWPDMERQIFLPISKRPLG